VPAVADCLAGDRQQVVPGVVSRVAFGGCEQPEGSERRSSSLTSGKSSTSVRGSFRAHRKVVGTSSALPHRLLCGRGLSGTGTSSVHRPAAVAEKLDGDVIAEPAAGRGPSARIGVAVLCRLALRHEVVELPPGGVVRATPVSTRSATGRSLPSMTVLQVARFRDSAWIVASVPQWTALVPGLSRATMSRH
jgi:hypothetical protein